MTLKSLRNTIRANHLRDEQEFINELIQHNSIENTIREKASQKAAHLVTKIRNDNSPGLMEVFMAEYGLSTSEGVALMCLAEALLRVPDSETIDDLIEDKIAPSSWSEHLGKSSSVMVNASTWGLMLTGKVLDDSGEGMAQTLKKAMKRLGEPVIRSAIKRAMKELGRQFVLGESIEDAINKSQDAHKQGYTFSYDMLGEAALTQADANDFYQDYKHAIASISKDKGQQDIRNKPGISVKLSALHPRYEEGQRERNMSELVESITQLVLQARNEDIGLNIDAEEADRLELSLDIIEAVLRRPELEGWNGFGVVVQAYSKRAPAVIDWLHELAKELNRKIMVRLVKGAYWDTEIKLAQVLGSENFPVFTQKHLTDICYLCCAKKLMDASDYIYPQFATHNAHTVAAILAMTDDYSKFEFQRLHGMGETLYKHVLKENDVRCRIYAPVGEHRDLLAYLVRRLLENGANSSFVNQLLDNDIDPDIIATDPFSLLDRSKKHTAIQYPSDLFAPERENSKGWDLHNLDDVNHIETNRTPFKQQQWQVEPIIAGTIHKGEKQIVLNPANLEDQVGEVYECSDEDVETALANAKTWDACASDRAAIITKASHLFEDNFAEFFAILTREAGKTPLDAIAELREAVDFLRYYAARGTELENPARGLFTCISPWNFPLAIFTGQIAAALMAGNGVLAKPANPTTITAALAVKLLHEAGVPKEALQLLPGSGRVVGGKLSSDKRINGICFTGSTTTAKTIHQAMAKEIDPAAPLIAETGGLNCMIVDSTALPEQAVKDIIISAFQSAGQRCSALRLVYLQEDISELFLEMLYGAMNELVIGNPWEFNTDIGPVISESAHKDISQYIQEAKDKGIVLKELDAPSSGYFIPPTVIKVSGIKDLTHEVFGPVLHVATFKTSQIDSIVDDINASGYGLTFGIHSRIDSRVDQVISRLHVGNIYVNRNQIGAIVGSQPFGGEGLSGTGPKAGGPNYVSRFSQPNSETASITKGNTVSFEQAQELLNSVSVTKNQKLGTESLPGPTGESNQLSRYGRGVILCLGPTAELAQKQAQIVTENGCQAVIIAPGATGQNAIDGVLDREALKDLTNFDAIALASDKEDLRAVREALSKRDGALITLLSEQDLNIRCQIERHVCIDTTAAGGNTQLMSQADI